MSKVFPPILGEPRSRSVPRHTRGLSIYAFRDRRVDLLIGNPGLVRREPAPATKVGAAVRKTSSQRGVDGKKGCGEASRHALKG
jgi:hypothetical protein